MKHGCIIYVVGDEPLHDDEMQVLIRNNGLNDTECMVCGVKPLPDIFRAYQSLQQRQVTDIACISVQYNASTRNYTFLERSMSLDGFADLSALCSPEEMAC